MDLNIKAIISGYLRRIPPEAMKTVRELLPVAVDSLSLIDLDKKEGEKQIVIICTLDKDNINLDIAAAALKEINGQTYYIITRTVTERMVVLPKEEKNG